MITTCRSFLIFICMLIYLSGCNGPSETSRSIEEQVKENEVVGMSADRSSRQLFLPTDPNTADAFWRVLDEEIEAHIRRVETLTYKMPAERLAEMVRMDQVLRGFWAKPNIVKSHFVEDDELTKFRTGISVRIQQIDKFNTNILNDMLKERDWFSDHVDGNGAAGNAWLIAQHADHSPEFQKDVLKRIERNLENPGVSARNYAYLYDRVGAGFQSGKTDQERLQKYGTQGRCTENDGWQPIRLEDSERVDEFRAEVGLGPLSEYKKRFDCADRK